MSEKTPQKHFQVVQYRLRTGIASGKVCGQGYKHFVPCNPQSRFSSVLVKNASGPQEAGSMPHQEPFFLFFLKLKSHRSCDLLGNLLSVSLFCCSVMRAAVAAFVLLCQNKVRYWLIYNWGYANQTWYATGQYLISAECITLLSDKPCVPRSSI